MFVSKIVLFLSLLFYTNCSVKLKHIGLDMFIDELVTDSILDSKNETIFVLKKNGTDVTEESVTTNSIQNIIEEGTTLSIENITILLGERATTLSTKNLTSLSEEIGTIPFTKNMTRLREERVTTLTTENMTITSEVMETTPSTEYISSLSEERRTTLSRDNITNLQEEKGTTFSTENITRLIEDNGTTIFIENITSPIEEMTTTHSITTSTVECETNKSREDTTTITEEIPTIPFEAKTTSLINVGITPFVENRSSSIEENISYTEQNETSFPKESETTLSIVNQTLTEENTTFLGEEFRTNLTEEIGTSFSRDNGTTPYSENATTLLPLFSSITEKNESNESMVTNITTTTQISTNSSAEDVPTIFERIFSTITASPPKSTAPPLLIFDVFSVNINSSDKMLSTTTTQISTTNSSTEEVSTLYERTLSTLTVSPPKSTVPPLVIVDVFPVNINSSDKMLSTTTTQISTTYSSTEEVPKKFEKTVSTASVSSFETTVHPIVIVDVFPVNISSFDKTLSTTTTPSNKVVQNMSQTLKENITDFTLEDRSINTINITINQTKTLEEIYEEEHKLSNDSALIESSTEVSQPLNSTIFTDIIAAGPGIPIFLEPPEFKIHDPDEGPLEPYLHPSNDSDDQYYPPTDTPGQEFIMMKRPEFIPEKGSLEEKYKHLLTADEESDNSVPSDVFPTTTTNKPNELLTKTTLNPDLSQRLPLPYMYYPYGYQYVYNPYTGQYQAYWRPNYGSGYPNNYWQQTYSGYPYNQYYGNYNYGQPVVNTLTEGITSTTSTTTESYKKLLPKSFSKFGAYIAKVSLDEKQSKEVAQGDEDTLEAMGPIEWLTTTSPKEIKFLINQKKIDQMIRNNRIKTALHSKQRKPSSESNPQNIQTNISSHPLPVFNTNTNNKSIDIRLQTNPRKIVFRRRKLPKMIDNKKKRIRIQKIVEKKEPFVDTEHSFDSRNSYIVRGGQRIPTIRRRIHRIRVRPLNSTQKPEAFKNGLKTHEISLKSKDLENKTHIEENSKSDSPLSEPDWKIAKKPKLLMMAKIKSLSKLKVDALTGIKWWHQDQPSYCSEPIYVLNDCSNRRLTKRWSYNPIDKKCYLYEDLCSHFKANSFETSKECFRKCYRVKE